MVDPESQDGRPWCVVVDVDGTVALKGARGQFDWAKVDLDLPNPPVIAAVEAARAYGDRIVFCTGREDTARRKTEAWLAEHVGRTPDEPVLMRRRKDFRKDGVTKRELYDQQIEPHYRVRYVLEDRSSAVAMWRGLGLTVLQVAEGDY